MLAVDHALDHICVVVPGEPMPDQQVRLGDEILYVGGALGETHDAEPAFPPALGDSDQHLARLVETTAFGDVLVNLLDEHEERLQGGLLAGKQLPGGLPDQRVGLVAVDVARDVEDDRDELIQGEVGELTGVFRSDLEITLLGRTDMEEFVLLFRPQYSPSTSTTSSGRFWASNSSETTLPVLDFLSRTCR
ncbi:hypothetical protein ACFQL0_21185 [Haloplanus litoreus]|uniref:hypothetical protein n=1 Tax=Haloplanus litoreus TaxID=767515 RepID=UPI00360D9816